MTGGAVQSRSRLLLKLLGVLGTWALGVAAVPLLGTGFTSVRSCSIAARVQGTALEGEECFEASLHHALIILLDLLDS